MSKKYVKEKWRLHDLAGRCIEQLESVGIDVPKDIKLFVEDADKSTEKECLAFTRNKRIGNQWLGSSIHVKNSVMRECVPDPVCMHVIMHELLHACAPGCEHDGRWLQLVEHVNKKLHYDIGQFASHEVSESIRRSERTCQEHAASYSQADGKKVAGDWPCVDRKQRSNSPWHILLGSMNVVIRGDIHLTCGNCKCDYKLDLRQDERGGLTVYRCGNCGSSLILKNQ